MQKNMYVGTYTCNSSSRGIYACILDENIGSIFLNDTEENCENPNFIDVNWEKRRLCALNEKKNEVWISSYSICQDGSLQYIDKLEIRGEGPCHISMDYEARKVFYANYISGNVGMVMLDREGYFTGEQCEAKHWGSSFHERQTSPHPHEVYLLYDQKTLLVPDLGTDEIVIYKIRCNQLERVGIQKVAPGDGPRHLVMHPNHRWIYLICEIENVVYAYEWTEETFKELQRISILDETMIKAYIGGEITITRDGSWLITSTRAWGNHKMEEGYLTVFRIMEDGRIEDRKLFSSGGCHPRMITLVGNDQYVLVANQYSGQVVSFKFDVSTGILEKKGQISIPEAACVWSE